jgi:hypothetical protein
MPTSRSLVIGFLLCGIDDVTFGERLLCLTELASLQVAELRCDRLDRRADRSARVEELRVTVTSKYLGSWHGLQTEGSADEGLDGRFDVRVVPDRAGQFADCDRLASPAQSRSVSVDLETVEGELCTKGCRLGMHPMRSPEDRRRRVLDRLATKRFDEPISRRDQEIRRPHQGDGLRGVHDVGGGEPVVDPRSGGRPDVGLDDVDERGHIVIREALALVYGLDEGGVDDWSRAADLLGMLCWHHAERGPRLGRENLDLEPESKSLLVVEDRPHLCK